MKMKKMMSVVALTTILGTSVEAPLNVLSAKAFAAEGGADSRAVVDNPNLLKETGTLTQVKPEEFQSSSVKHQVGNTLLNNTKGTLNIGKLHNYNSSSSSADKWRVLVGAPTQLVNDKDVTSATTISIKHNRSAVTPDKVQTIASREIQTVPGKEYTYSFSQSAWRDGNLADDDTPIQLTGVTDNLGRNLATPNRAGGYTGEGDFWNKEEQKSITFTATSEITKVYLSFETKRVTTALGFQHSANGYAAKVSNMQVVKSVAQVQKDMEDNGAEDALNELFADDNVSTGILKPDVDQGDIDNVQDLIDAVTDEDKKAELQKELDKAQELLNEREEAQAELDRQEEASDAVKELFTDDDVNSGALKPGVDQGNIDNVQDLIDAVTDEDKKAELQKELDKAQDILDAMKASKGELTPNEFLVGTDKSVVGTFTGNVKKISLRINGKEHTGGSLKLDGSFSFYSQIHNIKKTDDVFVVGYDQYGQELSVKKVNFVATPATEGKIIPAEMSIPGHSNITGTYTGDVKSIIVTVNDIEYKGGTLVDGEFKFYSLDKIKSVNDVVVVKALDAAGNVLDTQTVKLNGKEVALTGIITPNEVSIPGDKNITGTYEGDVKSVIVTVNGTEYRGGTLANGEFKFYSQDKIMNVNDIVTIKAVDAKGNVLDTKTVTIKSSKTTGILSPNTMIIPGDNNIRGTYTGNVKKVVVTVNGKEYRGGTIANGEFKFYSLDKIKSVDDVVIMTAFDSEGKELDKKIIQIEAPNK
ncbi:hypothetical protein PGRAN_15877 [Listeria grandensis FSL F6-0971]|uniref:Bacterial Ig domain-containing protein n=1 Tax=Listeria grandensis FSL F6-0971 TaxID=1265819 RepID=W7AYB6_9LIST|nr:immunoglobulin-like domain-containing protein [Listeria grandensis]EUJ18235.1 hypothetical protein PGRAN_15877 [Listeria grandensis FSL F6-0971]